MILEILYLCKRQTSSADYSRPQDFAAVDCSLDGIQTDWFGTVIEFKNRIAIVSVVIPPKPHWKKQPKEYYNDFVNSLEQL